MFRNIITNIIESLFAKFLRFSVCVCAFAICVFFVACSPESVYLGGVGSFKNYESINEYGTRSKRQSSAQAYSSYSGFGGSLTLPDSYNNSNKNSSYTQSKNSAYESNYDGSAPVSGSGNFQKSDSLLKGMRDSEAIQRATMRPYQVGGKTYYPTKVKVGDTFDGQASWYGPDFHAKSTSNGETYNMYAHTAASKTLPMNTIVKVFNKENSKTTVVRINDRGPFVEGRIIDLSNIAARDIEMVGKGTANVRIEVIGFGGVISNDAKNTLTQSQQEKVKNEIKVGPTSTSAISQGFILILSSFSAQDRAEFYRDQNVNLIKNSNYKLIITQSNGRYRVGIAGFKSQDEANDFKNANAINGFVIAQ